MEEILVRFFSAMIASILSIVCFYVGNEMIIVWWGAVHLSMYVELLKIVSPYTIPGMSVATTVIVSQLFFIEATLKIYGIPLDILISLGFVPFVMSVFDKGRNFHSIAVMSTSYLWVTYPCLIGVELGLASPSFMVGFLNIVWWSDAGAYFCGKLYGRTPLLEQVSPKKSREGTLGALVLGQIVALIVSRYVPQVSLQHWQHIALISSVMGQIGDLFESFFKRNSLIKDSGTIMPGHGGMLDRFDAILFALVFVRIYIVAFGIQLT
jgi:phosphatidate cytidylyltransferase